MYGGISTGLLNMTVDVYRQQNIQDENTGAVVRDWVFYKRIPCHIDIMNTEGTSVADNNKQFGFEYTEVFRIKMKSTEKLSKRYRLKNIKNRSGQLLFVEQDQIGEPPTVFDIESYHPRLDPFGNLLYYESNLRRSQVQDG